MSRYVIYARVSTGMEEQESSFETQMTELQTRVELLYPDYQFVKAYGDRGISGTKEKREAFQDMISDGKKGLFDVVVTKNISRFARNTRVLLNTLETFSKLGIKVLFLEDNIDSSSASQQFLLTILGALAQMESQNTSSHLRETYAIKRVSGKLARPCACCFGYKYDKKTDTISIVEEEAELVKQIFSWFIEDNLSQGKIASMLTNKGIPTPYGKRDWSRGQVNKIIVCEKYVGKATETDTKTGTKYHFDDVYPPILDVATFQKAQDIVEGRKKKHYKRRAPSLYALSHICECTCGRRCTRFTRVKQKRFELEDISSGSCYWGCTSITTPKLEGVKRCYGLSEEYIYEAIIESIVFVACGNKVLLEEEWIDKTDYDAYFSAIEQSNKHFKSELSAYEQRKKDLEKERQKEIKLFKADIISEAELKANIHIIDKKLRELTPPTTPDMQSINSEHLKAFLSAVDSKDVDECRARLFELFKDIEFKRSIVNTLVEKIYIGGEPKNKISVELKNPRAMCTYIYKHKSPYRRGGIVRRELPSPFIFGESAGENMETL